MRREAEFISDASLAASDAPPAYAMKLTGARSITLGWNETPAQGKGASAGRCWCWVVSGHAENHRAAIIAAGGKWSAKRRMYWIDGVDQLPPGLAVLGLRCKVSRARG